MPNNIDDIFKKASENTDIPKPDPALWNNLKTDLKEKGLIGAPPSSAFTFLKGNSLFFGAAASVVLSLSIFYLLTNSNTQEVQSKNQTETINYTNNQIEANANNKNSAINKYEFEDSNNDKVKNLVKKAPSTNSNKNNETIKSTNSLNGNNQSHDKNNNNNQNFIKNNLSSSGLVNSKNNKPLKETSKTFEQKDNSSSKGDENSNQNYTENYLSNNNFVNSDNNQTTKNTTNNFSNIISTSEQKNNSLSNENSDQNYTENYSSNNNFVNSDNNQTTKNNTFSNNDPNILSSSNLIPSNDNNSSLFNEKNSTILNTINSNNKFSQRNQIPYLSINQFRLQENFLRSEIENIENQDSVQELFKSIQTKPNKTRAYIRPYFSLDYTFYSNAKDSTVAYLAKGSGQVNYTVGVFGGYNIWGNLYAETGILYSNRGNINWNYENINGSANNVQFKINSNYLLIPLKMRYNITNHAFTFYTSAGANLKFNIATKNSYYTYSDIENALEYKVSPKSSSMGLDLLLNAGVDWRILPELSFFIEPEFRYSVTSLLQVKDYNILPSNPKQHSFGVGLGLNYKFLKK